MIYTLIKIFVKLVLVSVCIIKYIQKHCLKASLLLLTKDHTIYVLLNNFFQENNIECCDKCLGYSFLKY
jgi:hypothetical protein